MQKIELIQQTCECPVCVHRDEVRKLTTENGKLTQQISEIKKQRESILRLSEEMLAKKDNKFYEDIIKELKVDIIIEEKNGVIVQLQHDVKKANDEIERILNIHAELKHQMENYLTFDATNEKLVEAREQLKKALLYSENLTIQIKKKKELLNQINPLLQKNLQQLKAMIAVQKSTTKK